ncbi:MAG: chalcone isomerase family protein [Bacteriovoracaceae bacterium]
MNKLILFFLCIPLYALDFPFEQKDMKLVGKALLEYSIFGFDVYELSYYKNEQGNKSLLILDYKRDLKKEYSIKGWEVGFEKNIQRKEYYSDSMNWLKENTPAVKEGDKLFIYREPNLVRIYKNKQLLAEKNDNKTAEIVFRPWLGQYPVDEDVKKSLLGKD